ncbi:uncharacterized protein [Macrobrachium rosenbergii]|uniref:uncharacterized protein n=1 Tax=Macrobrachium rosenbergii TaxID=79674 RepID=UPI0034D58A57
MEFPFVRILVLVTFSSLCDANVTEEKEDSNVLLVEAIEKGFERILQRLEDHQNKLATLDELHRKVSAITELQKRMTSMEEQLADLKDYARKEEVESFFNKTETELRNIGAALNKCSTADQVSEFRDIMQADECKEDTHECSEFALCNDKLMKYHCTCLPGYYGDGFTCQDVNECAEGNFACNRNEICVNTQGSYQCICRDGFMRIRNSCQDMTCTSPSLFLPTLGCITPVFTRMIWEQARGICEAMGKRLLQDIAEHDLETLGRYFGPLMEDSPQPWIGLRDYRWISSEEEVPDDIWAESTPGGGCGNIDLRPTKLGVWDGGCEFEDYALCQSV